MKELIKASFVRFKGLRKQQKAQSLVEFAFVFPIFMLLMFGIIDLARYYFVDESMAHTVRESARYAVTGKQELISGTNYYSRRESIIRVAKRNNPGLLDISAAVANPKSGDTFTLTPADGGVAKGPIQISLEQDFTFVTPFMNLVMGNPGQTNRAYKLKTSVRYQNEPFDND